MIRWRFQNCQCQCTYCVRSQITTAMPVSTSLYRRKRRGNINRQHCSVTLAVSSYLENCLEVLALEHCIDGAIGLTTYRSTSLVAFWFIWWNNWCFQVKVSDTNCKLLVYQDNLKSKAKCFKLCWSISNIVSWSEYGVVPEIVVFCLILCRQICQLVTIHHLPQKWDFVQI